MRVELIFQISEYYIPDFDVIGRAESEGLREGEWWWSPNFYNPACGEPISN